MCKKWLAGIMAAALVLTGAPVTSYASEGAGTVQVSPEEQSGAVESDSAEEVSESAASNTEEEPESVESSTEEEPESAASGTEEGTEPVESSTEEEPESVGSGSEEGTESTGNDTAEEGTESVVNGEAESSDSSNAEEGEDASASETTEKNDGQDAESDTQEAGGEPAESAPTGNDGPASGAEMEGDVDTETDTGVTMGTARAGETGTYTPYEGAKYSLRYSVEDTEISIDGIAECESWDDLGELVIPAAIDGMKVTAIANRAFSYCSGLTGALVIPDGITKIGDGAFMNCSGLTGLVLPDTVTEISAQAFYYCSGLTGDLKISAGVTTIGEEAFSYCSGLTGALMILDGVTKIGDGAFRGCGGLTGLVLPGTVKEIGVQAFYYCNGLTGALMIPNGVTKIGDGAFRGCSSLTGLVLPDTVKEIGAQTFYGCENLTGDLVIPAGLTVVSEMAFYGCSGLNGELKLPDSVTVIGEGAFYGCSSLTGELKLPDSMTEIGEIAFCGCSGLSGELKIPAGVTVISSGVFSGCSGLTGELKIPAGVTEIGSAAFNNCSGLTGELKLPDGITVIPHSVFYGCSGLTGELKLPDSVTEIGNQAFYGCTGLNGELKLPAGVTVIGDSVFCKCSGLTGELKLPVGVTVVGNGAFLDCKGLTGLTLPAGLTAIGDSAFNNCSSLAGELKLPDGLTAIGNSAFYYCSSLTGELKIPSGITTIGYSAFSGCSGLTGELKLPESMTEIGNGIFSSCSGLTSLNLPEGVTVIGDNAFSGCSGLTGLNLPDSVVEIGKSAFSYCSGLTGELKLPKSLTAISQNTFSGCSGLTSVKISDRITEIGDYAFSYCNGIQNVEIPTTVAAIGRNAFSAIAGNHIGRITVQGTETAIQSGGLGSNFFIMGHNGSTAEQYALENNCTFIPLENAPEITEHRVSTAQELMETLGSLGQGYSRIILADGIYDVPLEGDASSAYWAPAPVTLKGLVSVTIEAEHPGRVEILSKNVQAPVVSIIRSTDIHISGCILGHRSDIEIGDVCGEKGYVVSAENSFDIDIEDSDLYGCGITAIRCAKTEAVNVSDCVLRDCMRDVANGYGEDLNIRNCIISGNGYSYGTYSEAFTYQGHILLENCLLFNNKNGKLKSEAEEGAENKVEVEIVNCAFYDNAWEEGQIPGKYGICLNGITWQVEGGILKLGYPLKLDDNKVIQSSEGEVLDYSTSSLPWKLYKNLKVAVAEGIESDQSVTTAVSGLDISVIAPMTEEEQEKLIKKLAEKEGIAPEGARVEIKVTDAADSLSEQDRTFMERFAQTNRVTASQYLDITMSILPQGGEKKPVKWTDMPVQLVVEVPENLRQEDRIFSVIRMHEGSFDLLQDLDTDPETVTIETNCFSVYALAYKDAVKGSTIGGQAVKFGDPNREISLKLLDYQGNVVSEASYAGNSAEYSFEGIAAGSYTLSVSSYGHVQRWYNVTVEENTISVKMDVEIWLRGDVNGDGEIDAKDKRLLYNHIVSGILTGYEFQVGDVDGSGEIDAKDKRMLYNHIAGTGLLW